MDYKEFSGKIKAKYPQYNDMDDMTLAKKLVTKYPQYSDVTFDQPKQGIIQKGWDALGKPEQMSRQGLGQLAGMVPEGKVTGNMPMDLLRGTPKIAANTMAQAAPGFVSRGSILTGLALPAMKAAAPVAKAVGRGVGSQLESLSGLKPGLLGQAFKDPSLIFSHIPQSARDVYKAGNATLEESPLSKIANPKVMVLRALKMAKDGALKPEEAVEARKEIDKLFGSRAVTETFKNSSRKVLDAVAKSDEDIAGADKAFSRGKKAAQLRQFFPQNKYGGASPFKMMMGEIMSKGGIPGKILASLLSPIASGTAATALGAGAKVAQPFMDDPKLAITALQALRARRNLSNEQ